MGKIVTFGEVMLRLAPPDFLRFRQSTFLESTFGGGEANVAVSCANYGMDVSFVTRLPKNDISEWCLRTLRQANVDTSDIVFGGDRIGIYFLETGAVSRGSKVVYDRANSAISQIEPGMIDWNKVLDGASWREQRMFALKASRQRTAKESQFPVT
jgi:2-dehydro-3-deoxygluconokinase